MPVASAAASWSWIPVTARARARLPSIRRPARQHQEGAGHLRRHHLFRLDPILTSVTAPAGVVQVSPASSSPTLTALGRDGKTNGVFFRTITSDALQGTASAKYALDQGLKKIAIIHVNNDFGVNMVKNSRRLYQAGRHVHHHHAL